MNKYSFGVRSLSILKSCHIDLQLIFSTAISLSPVDFGIAEGHRDIERQKKLYDEGKSKIDGTTQLGKHNHNPSLAVDIFIYHPDPATRRRLAYNKESLCLVAGVILSCAEDLYSKGLVLSRARWGGNWDMDGEILTDQSFEDLVHFELI